MWPFITHKQRAAEQEAFNRARKNNVRRKMLRFLNNVQIGRISQKDARDESRTRLALRVALVPLKDEKPDFQHVDYVTSLDASSSGIGVISAFPLRSENALLAFRIDDQLRVFSAKQTHCHGSAGNIYLSGFELTELLSDQDFPEIEKLDV